MLFIFELKLLVDIKIVYLENVKKFIEIFIFSNIKSNLIVLLECKV